MAFKFGFVVMAAAVICCTNMVHSYQTLRTQAMAPAAAILFQPQASESYPAVFAVRSDNMYSPPTNDQQQQQQWQQFQQQYPDQVAAAAMILQAAAANQQARSGNMEDICQGGGFVEHCLVQANQDGEQRLLEIGGNQTDLNRDSLSNEFDGMCQVVLRFIDCINVHHVRCNQQANDQQQQLQQNMQTDVFYKSWSEMCGADSKIRNKYLQHAKCIKHALSHNNGQDQCQALFQQYFFSSQFQMDSIETTVQYGCCAFNEWQYCIDTLIQRQCGSDATKSIQDLIDQASAGLVSSLCEKKLFGRKSKACIGKKNYNYNKLNTLNPQMNATLQKYISIFGDFIDRLPDDEDEDEEAQQVGQIGQN